jgi:hypothetical protein
MYLFLSNDSVDSVLQVSPELGSPGMHMTAEHDSRLARTTPLLQVKAPNQGQGVIHVPNPPNLKTNPLPLKKTMGAN